MPNSRDFHSLYSSEVDTILSQQGEVVDPGQPQALDVPQKFLAKRIEECGRISRLLEENNSFSFLRLGDMELTMMLAHQDGLTEGGEDFGPSGRHRISGTAADGSPGLSMRHVNRLKQAFEKADYVDFHELLRVNRALLPKLSLKRQCGAARNPDQWTSYILPLWVTEEFRRFCARPGRRCGIAGAEASLLEWLSVRREFREAAGNVWPREAAFAFHQLRGNGRDIDGLLDVVKEDLKAFISMEQIDTLFLSMGGGAKILCQELAEECGIRAVDFGAMTRALCDLGSDGNRTTRSTHSIQLYRLPCSMVVDGIVATRLDLTHVELLAKTHAQLIHQLLGDRLGYSRGNSMLDLGKESRARFRKALSECGPLIKKLQRADFSGTRKESADFLHFCGKHRLTIQGRIFWLVHWAKGCVRKCLDSARSLL